MHVGVVNFNAPVSFSLPVCLSFFLSLFPTYCFVADFDGVGFHDRRKTSMGRRTFVFRIGLSLFCLRVLQMQVRGRICEHL